MRKRIFKITGIVVVVIALCANLQYALFNYGLKDGKLSEAVMAQSSGSNTNGTTTGTTTGDIWFKHDVVTNVACTTVHEQLQVLDGRTLTTVTTFYGSTKVDCEYLGTGCTPGCGNITAISVSYRTNW